MLVTVWESDGGRIEEDRRGQEGASSLFCAEIMIYSEEILSSPVCNAELHAVRKYLPGPQLERSTL